MADLAEKNPVQSPEERRAAHDLDQKLIRVARENRAKVEARQAQGKAGTVAEMIAEKFATVAAAIERPPERLLRVMPDEGDAPAVPVVYRSGMIPARFADVTFDTYQPQSRSQEAALGAARFWLERALAGEGCMLALIGPQGTGKSHLLYAAANALLDAGKRPYARPWYRLADELRYGGEHPVTKQELEAADVRRSLWTQKIVLLDEVRATASTAFDDMELTKFACHSYDSRYPMFVTTNINPLADVMGGPAASRYTQVVIEGPDWRQK